MYVVGFPSSPLFFFFCLTLNNNPPNSATCLHGNIQIMAPQTEKILRLKLKHLFL